MAQQASYAIAGLQPDRRPSAPKVIDINRSWQWYARAFSGIEQPYPWSLSFVNGQGNWHTPFSDPGMTGKYDLRGWHLETTAIAGSANQK